MTPPLSRRDFLKLSGTTLLALLLEPPAWLGAPPNTPMQGRVAYTRVRSYALPSSSAPRVNILPRDTLLEITASVQGGEPGDANPTWYQLSPAEYVHSGGIQPVRSLAQPTVTDLPQEGCVGELSLPFIDSYWAVDRAPFRGPRLYYASTHWIQALYADAGGRDWYKAHDPLYNAYYYIPAEAVRILPAEELAPLSPDVPARDKFIQVQLDAQVLLAFEGPDLAFSCRVSTGKGVYFTPQGWFTTFHKRPSAHMVGGGEDASMYDLTGVPWDTYITENGIAMHGTFWHNDYGTPRSHGCINLTPQEARRIYRWTLPAVPAGQRSLYEPGTGTPVQVVSSDHSNFRRQT